MMKSVLVTTLALVMLVGVYLGSRYLTGSLNPVSAGVQEFDNSSCHSFGGSCEAQADQKSMRVRFPANPHSLESFPIEVRLTGLPADDVLVDFQGADMYMGPNQVILHADPDGVYRGNAELVSCSTGHMKWIATITPRQAARPMARMRLTFYAD